MRAKMRNDDIKTLCMKLLRADSEEEVISRLKTAGYWDDRKCWRLYGDNPNNRGTAGAQQAHSDAALVEKLVNSIDATLMNQCLIRGIDPTSKYAPSSMREAVIKFYDEDAEPESIYAGRFSFWADNKITQIARDLTISATGLPAKKGDPCFTIVDKGEGQTPEMFPYTLLTLSESNKKQISFVQGAFSMGGTGVLRFCGEKKMQLFISRRNPYLVNQKQKYPSDKQWGFTIVRRNCSVDMEAAFYEYLAPYQSESGDGTMGVLRFTSESLPVFPEKNDAYVRHSEWGTVVKLYEYSCVGFGKSSVHRKDGLTARLQLRLPRPGLPIRSYECRRAYGGEKDRSYEYNVTGIIYRIEQSRKKEENLEAKIDFPIHIEKEVINVTVYVFKKDKHKTFKKNEGVLFLFNGQTQGHLTQAFFASDRVGLSYIQESLLVVVDCSNLGPINQDELFMSNRFTLVKTKFTEKVKIALVEQLRENQTLRELKNKRRQEQLKSKLDDQKPLEDVLRKILKKNKVLAALFAMGPRLSNPYNVKNVESSDTAFIGKRFPEFFKFKGKDIGYEFIKNCHKNMRFQLTFETDAEDEYFSREVEQGEFKLFQIRDGLRYDVENWAGPVLRSGIANVRVSLPANCSIGDELKYCALVMDESRLEPIENYCKIHVQPATSVTPNPTPPHPPKPPSNTSGKDRERLSGIAFPEIEEVTREKWENFNPNFDEYTALRIVNTGEPIQNNRLQNMIYDFYVNIDNIYLQSEMKASKLDPKVLRARFSFGLVLLGLGMIQQKNYNLSKNSNSDVAGNVNSNGDNIEIKVEEFTRSIAPVLLPMIDGLGGLDEKQLIVFGDTGEDI